MSCFLWYPAATTAGTASRPLILAETPAPAELGGAPIGTAIGALAGMPLTRRLIARFGSYRIAVVAGVMLCAVLPLPTLAPRLLVLFGSLLLLGLANGVLDVAINVQAVRVEAASERPMMSTFHALFGVGDLVGATGPAFAWPTRARFGLGVLAFFALICEWAIADWSAVYL